MSIVRALFGFFPITVHERGIVYRTEPYQDFPGVDPMDTTDVRAVVLRFHDPWVLDVVDPWPNARLRWKDGEMRVAPVGLGARPQRFAEDLERLYETLAAHPRHLGARGWLDAPVVRWEEVGRLPEPPTEATVGEGAFRSAPRPQEEELSAARTPPGTFETLLLWLASGPARPFRDTPKEVRLTATYLYAARWDGTLIRLPREALRTRLGEPDGDGVYIFGRNTPVILPRRSTPCPVREALDAELPAG